MTDEVGDGDGDGDGLDEAAILATASDYPNSFVLINAAPFESMHGGETVNVWAHPDIADQYKMIDPMNPAATTLPEGAMIIKEVVDDQMNVVSGTIMVKGPAGYSPDTDDWWFGMGDILGSSLADSGPDLAGCIGCHEPLAETDWLRGIPADEQNP